MLCKINATLGTTDEKARAMNFMRAVTNIFTATAGTTPTCNPLTAPSTFNNAINIITEVVSNTEGGGWATGNSNVTDAYNATLASYYQADFTSNVLTGKATYPYLKCTLSTNLSQTLAGTYTTYPYLDFRVGFNTTAWYGNTYAQAMTVANTTANIITSAPGAATVSTSVYPTIRPAAGEYLVAATSSYVAFLNSNSVTYFGYRATQGWEDPLVNNPPVVAFSANTFGDINSTTYSTYGASSANMISNYCAWMYAHQYVGQGNLTVSPRWYVNSVNSAGTWQSYSVVYNPMSGTVGTGSVAHVPNTFGPAAGSAPNLVWAGSVIGFELNSPLMYLRTHTTGILLGSVTDTITGSQVSAAWPIVFASTCQPALTAGQTHYAGAGTIPNISFGYNAGGAAIGIYKGSGGPDTYLANIWTAATNYTIGSDTYYSYRVGYNTANRDLFLIRKA